MAIFEIGASAASTGLNLGLVLLIVPVLAEWAKVRKGSEKAYAWIAAGGVSFILASAFGASGTLSTYAASAASSGWLLFDAVGFILVLVGALMALYNSVSG
ncbi:MAG: hypothetical protein HYS81_05180 [Candidatus Aenigmatarchaeota archaeon]|nr:MAG: hypothetical protein HYS81_05180 [Candidatus Aenigmarchaeota archaeon]